MAETAEETPRLSVAMIVKNEAGHLPHYLENIAPLADEICVLDTGSSDGTPELARRHGCRVGDFVWCDDFSAARNASMSLCRGAWILVLDADERIAAGDREALRALLTDDAASKVCYRFITRNYTNAVHLSDFVPCAAEDPHAGGYAGWFPSGKVRLFPNLPGTQFEGRVHELVNASLERSGCRVITSEIPIHHYPLDRPEAEVAAKRTFYLRLAEQRAAESPNDAMARAILAEQHVEQGDYGPAAAAYREALRLDPWNAGWMGELGGMLLLLGRREEARRALTLALRLDETRATAWRNLGVVHAQTEDWAAAVDCFRRAVGADAVNAESHRYLAVALQALGRPAEALDAAEQAVEANPRSIQAVQLLEQLRMETGGALPPG